MKGKSKGSASIESIGALYIHDELIALRDICLNQGLEFQSHLIGVAAESFDDILSPKRTVGVEQLQGEKKENVIALRNQNDLKNLFPQG